MVSKLNYIYILDRRITWWGGGGSSVSEAARKGKKSMFAPGAHLSAALGVHDGFIKN